MDISRNDLLLAVTSLTSVEEIDTVIELARQRRNVLLSVSASTLRAGSAAKFSSEVRPKYLIGLPVEVVKRNAKSVAVDCPDDAQYGRFRACKKVRVPLTLIEVA